MQLIFKEVAEEFDLKPAEVEFAYDACMRAFRVFMNNKYAILIANLGKIYIMRYRTMELMRRAIRHWRAGIISKERCLRRIAYYWAYHNAARYHRPGTGIKYKRRLKYGDKIEEGVPIKI